MSTPVDHFDLGLGWPPWKDEPDSKQKQSNATLALRIASLIAIVALSGANFWIRAPHAPREHVAIAKPLPLDQLEHLKKIAIDEVKKRNGWSGQAELRIQEGNVYFYVVKCESKQRTNYVQVQLDCFTGWVLDYHVL